MSGPGFPGGGFGGGFPGGGFGGGFPGRGVPNPLQQGPPGRQNPRGPEHPRSSLLEDGPNYPQAPQYPQYPSVPMPGPLPPGTFPVIGDRDLHGHGGGGMLFDPFHQQPDQARDPNFPLGRIPGARWDPIRPEVNPFPHRPGSLPRGGDAAPNPDHPPMPNSEWNNQFL